MFGENALRDTGNSALELREPHIGLRKQVVENHHLPLAADDLEG
ncbi:helicase domain-containing protein [Alicyclobacillus hesperidum URH17-3-68]|nr:helicase domain-containing protein [Alicyclobacillus hesperidum URH17-3-68]